MSSIAVSGNTSGSGEFSLEAPATTADRNITLADASGNVVISDGTTITADYTNNRFSFGGTVVFNGLTTGFNRWQILNANTNLVANKNYFANTQTTLTLTLPATANIGDTIRVFDNEGHASANVVTISRNGNKIDGFDRNVVISTDRDGVELVYVSGDIGFVSREQKTEGRFFGTQAQGESFGYTTGRQTTIDKFPFAVDTNATDIGDLSQGRQQAAGQSSLVSGYTSGGYSGESPPPTLRSVNIDKFPFAVDTNATDVGDLTIGRQGPSGQSSEVSGYATGGYTPPPAGGYLDTIDKFPFSVDTNATDVGNLTSGRYGTMGQSSTVNGYACGGGPRPAVGNKIEKFPFATDTNSTDIADLSGNRQNGGGCSSSVSGYTAGGDAPPFTNIIDKFPFATDANATDIGDLTGTRYNNAGHSSISNGYSSGGQNPGDIDVIDKFPFASDANATDVGNLSGTRKFVSGNQV